MRINRQKNIRFPCTILVRSRFTKRAKIQPAALFVLTGRGYVFSPDPHRRFWYEFLKPFLPIGKWKDYASHNLSDIPQISSNALTTFFTINPIRSSLLPSDSFLKYSINKLSIASSR